MAQISWAEGPVPMLYSSIFYEMKEYSELGAKFKSLQRNNTTEETNMYQLSMT